MNREIKFRGKRRDNGKWVYGLPAYTSGGEIGKVAGWTDDGDDAVGTYFEVEVIPETVGQFTGLKDKNGKDIYEGDIINIKDGCVVSQTWSYEKEDLIEVCEDHVAQVVFDEGMFSYDHGTAGCLCPLHTDMDKIEVIGNIHDNPELLKQ